MKLAVIADIHGNLPALEAVLEDAHSAGADTFVCLGDVANFGPEPRGTLRRVQALGCPVVMGNTDDALLQSAAPSDGASLEGEAVVFGDLERWCAEQLTNDDRAFVRTFEPTVRLELGGLALLCVHGSPRSYHDPITATTPDDVLSDYLTDRAPLLFGGHTHQPFLRRFEEVTFVNPGSVGTPFERRADGSARSLPWAEYALVEVRGEPSITFRRVPYDIPALIAWVRSGSMPHAEWWLAGWLTSPHPAP